MTTSTTGLEKTKTCPRCRDTFTCRSGGCWCTNMWVPAVVLEALKKDYTDCLCKNCLEEIMARYCKENPHVAPPAAPPRKLKLAAD